MNNLAIVPARGGSKRLPGKNVKHLNGKPLIQYTLEAVSNSGVYNDIILSSDDDAILSIANNVKGVTAEKRPSRLAGDKSKVIELIKEIAERPGYDEKYDTISLFLPTCPFRTAQHIAEGYKLLEKDDFSVVSVCEMSDPIQLSLTIDEATTVMNPNAVLDPSPLITGNTRSQDFQKFYRVNGGFYIAWLKKFKGKENFFQGQVKSYVMSTMNSVDIDNQIDFDWAQFLLNNGYVTI